MGIVMKNNKNMLFNLLFLRYTRMISLCIVLGFIVLPVPFSVATTQEAETVSFTPQELLSEKAGWEQIDSGVTQDLNSVFFICLNRGTIVGDGGLILRTGDEGDNWTVQDSGVIDNLHAVAYYGYSITLAVGTSGTILYTTTTGQNWTVLQNGMMGTYYSCQMINDTIGVAVGVNAIFQPFFTRTNDGWNTWDSSSFYIEHESVFYEGRLSDVCFLNASVGFATAIVDIPAGGAILRTTNGGSTWDTVFFYDEALLSIDFTYDGVGYAVGDHGAIVRSLDDGGTWQELESGVNNMLHAVDFSSENRGTIVGDNGIILRTENAGLSWTPQTSGTTVDLLAVYCVTDMFAIVTGEQGVILRTNTGGYPDDITPPQTTCTLEGTLDGNVYISDVFVSLNATDDISGVTTTMYKLDEAIWDIYVGPFTVTGDGTHLLLFYSVDNAGNSEEEQTCEFIIQHRPTLQITITGGFGIKIHIKNLGSTNVAQEPWTLSLDGGLILFGKQKTGEIDINAGDEITLNTWVFGFGTPTITFSIASFQKIEQSKVFLFLVRI